jgi:hypothetical protein
MPPPTMSTKKYSTLKYWLTIGSVAFGVSGGCSLLITQNLLQSILVGFAAVPGVAASITVQSRQRQQQVNRQLERGKLRLNELQYRTDVIAEQLQLKSKDRQEIELKVSQLYSLVDSLNHRIDTDRHRHQQLEQELNVLALYCQEQQTFATNLDRKIQDKQALNLAADTNFNHLKQELSLLQAEQLRVQGSRDRSSKILTDTQTEIARLTIVKQELERHTEALQSQQQVELTQVELQTAVAAETELALQAKQVELDELESELIDKTNAIELCDRELKRSNLELSSKQAELDNLEFKLQTRLQAIDEIDLEKSLQILEPKPPIVSRSIALPGVNEPWCDRFIDNPHLGILQHIEKHGTITEAEASSKLGNARSVRQFANKLEEYAPDLPFSIRVESSPKGNRYLKETQN